MVRRYCSKYVRYVYEGERAQVHLRLPLPVYDKAFSTSRERHVSLNELIGGILADTLGVQAEPTSRRNCEWCGGEFVAAGCKRFCTKRCARKSWAEIDGRH